VAWALLRIDQGASISHCCALHEARGRTVRPRGSISVWTPGLEPWLWTVLLEHSVCISASLGRDFAGASWGHSITCTEGLDLGLSPVGRGDTIQRGTQRGQGLSLPLLLPRPWQTSSLDTSPGASQGQLPGGWDPPSSGNAGLLGFSALLPPKCRWQITNASPRDEQEGRNRAEEEGVGCISWERGGECVCGFSSVLYEAVFVPVSQTHTLFQQSLAQTPG